MVSSNHVRHGTWSLTSHYSYWFSMMERTTVYGKRNKHWFVVLFLYVNDILVVGKVEMLSETKSSLSSIIKMKDMGETSYVLPVITIKIRSKKLLGLSQKNYVQKILKHFQMNNSKFLWQSNLKRTTLKPKLLSRNR